MKFLVDANLPRKFTWFNTPDFTFAADWGLRFPDKEIWDYALKNDMVILTRDSDYFYWMIQAKKSPKVVYFKLRNKDEKNLRSILSLIGNKYVN